MYEMFGRKIFETVVKGGIKDYENMCNNLSDNSGEGYWYELKCFYNELSKNEKSILFKFMETIMIDTTAHVLGVIDGTCSLEGGGTFDFEIALDGKDMMCELQDSFLAYVEEQESNNSKMDIGN